jgi:hypothetical protein
MPSIAPDGRGDAETHSHRATPLSAGRLKERASQMPGVVSRKSPILLRRKDVPVRKKLITRQISIRKACV